MRFLVLLDLSNNFLDLLLMQSFLGAGLSLGAALERTNLSFQAKKLACESVSTAHRTSGMAAMPPATFLMTMGSLSLAGSNAGSCARLSVFLAFFLKEISIEMTLWSSRTMDKSIVSSTMDFPTEARNVLSNTNIINP